MSDFALAFDEISKRVDLALDGADLARDDGLRTAVILSLFTDARVSQEELNAARAFGLAGGEREGGQEDLRGWWGNAIPPRQLEGSGASWQMGSKLWLLQRERQTPATLVRARDYVREALAWMIEDGVAERVEATTRYARLGVMAIEVSIVRPAGAAARFDFYWRAEANRLEGAA